MTMYCLEILRYIKDEEDVRARGGIFEHVGYEHRVDPSTGHRQILRFRGRRDSIETRRSISVCFFFIRLGVLLKTTLITHTRFQ